MALILFIISLKDLLLKICVMAQIEFASRRVLSEAPMTVLMFGQYRPHRVYNYNPFICNPSSSLYFLVAILSGQ